MIPIAANMMIAMIPVSGSYFWEATISMEVATGYEVYRKLIMGSHGSSLANMDIEILQ
jgi:hypothetical protein